MNLDLKRWLSRICALTINPNGLMGGNPPVPHKMCPRSSELLGFFSSEKIGTGGLVYRFSVRHEGIPPNPFHLSF
jgi:hypothetical protein